MTLNSQDLLGHKALYETLLPAYTEPHRAYHNLQHIYDCLALFEEYKHLAQHPDDVTIAIWFHDAIYDTHAKGHL